MININFDLYILKSDISKLEKGEMVLGYKVVSTPNEYELISQYAFLPATKIDNNTYEVAVIMK